MKEFKKDVLKIVTEINTNWHDEIKEAENRGEGLDIGEVLVKFSRNIEELEEAFIRCEERLYPKKKGLFGGKK